MEIIYANSKVEKLCSDTATANKFFGGNNMLTASLISKINDLTSTDSLKNIILLPSYRFHNLHNKDGRNLDGYFAIDVKTKKEPWRIILQPLNENMEPYNPCRIDEIAESVKRIRIMEVSRHYE